MHRFQAIKGPDFVSRLKGILDIKGPNPTCVTDKKHIIRRAMLLRSLILKNVKGICHPDTGRVDISRGLLCALLRVSEYRHGARSIEFILGMSRLAGASRYTPSCLPLAAQLDIHVDVQDFMRKLSFEQMMGEAVEQYAFTAHEKYRQKHLADAQARGATPKELSLVRQEPEMADWSDLDEFYKEGHRSQIRYLGEMVRPTVAVITNIGDAHIENLGNTRQGTLRAKSEIFEHLQPGGLVVLNGDDALLAELELPFETILCGRGENCTVRVTDIVTHGVEGLSCTVTTPCGVYPLHIPSPGDYMIYPASMAVAIGERLGLTAQQIQEGVAHYVSTGSRMRRIRLPEERLIIDDCYNANPQAMAAALTILADTDCRRRVAVMGDMGELGRLSSDAHREAGALAARLGLDQVIAIGEKARLMAQGAGNIALHFDTVEQAMPAVQEALTPGTAMLVKASHAMHFGWIVEQLKQAYD